jgi:hypothetical protein
VLAVKGHTAGRYLLAAGGIFFVSMLFRTIDLEVCDLTRVGGHALGTHFLWHILNGTALYLLLRAAILSGRRPEHSGRRPVDSVAGAPG